MKKTFLMAAFAALALVFATSCEKDEDNTKEDNTENTGKYPKDLAGYWIPVSAEGSDSYFMVGSTVNGMAECSVHISEAPVDLMTGHVIYNAETGAGTFELDAETARLLPTLVVKLQAKDEDLVTVSRSIDNGQTFMHADFKRVEKPDNGGNNGGNQGDDTIVRTWPIEPIGHYISEGNDYYAMIGEDSIENDNIYTIEIWNLDEDGSFLGTITYDSETGAITANLSNLPDNYAQFASLLNSDMISIVFINENTFRFTITAMGRAMFDMTFSRFNPAGK